MKKEYDFSRGKRGAVLPVGPGKTRITIRLDDDIIEWFRRTLDNAGGGSYQTAINAALREYMTRAHDPLEASLRKVVRETLAPYVKKAARAQGRRA
jgi:hypothetical protein